MKVALRTVCLAVLLVCGQSHGATAVELTAAQRATLLAGIVASPDLAQLRTDGNLAGLAAALNAVASPSFTVWKSMVTITQIGDNIVATELAGLSSLNSTRLQTIVALSAEGVNPSLADRRAFFDDIFSGSGGAGTRAKLLILWKRLATRLEKLFATGTGSDAVPATMTVEGSISDTDLIGL